MNLARVATAGALLALTSLGCTDEPELVIVIAHPTLIQVSPTAFLGTVPCMAGEGAMQRYVATVFDVSPESDEEMGAGGAVAGPAENFALPSSGPTPCGAPIATAFVVHGRLYAAEIDGYDRDDIEPLATGARQMVDQDGEIVPPRWTTSCGREPGESVMAIYQVTREVSSCEPLEDHSPSAAEPKIAVSLDDALGDLACGTDPGQVARFEVVSTNGDTAEATCGDAATLTGVSPGAVLELQVLAYESGQTSPAWGSACSAAPLTGVTVQAECQILASEGALDIDLPQVLESIPLDCETELREVVADPGGDLPAQRVTPPGCNNTLRLSDLPPGDTTVSLSTTLSDGSTGPTLTCSGTVLPGLSVPADCTEG
ncbi:MAG TPA: hypothetical protein VM686_15745 [Polyangiaceae bacterium]|nr:hypothetical protein [Polyangiaceae bacterium]